MADHPPLKPLHPDSVLNQVKLALFERLSSEELIASLAPGQLGSLKARPDGTMLDGHHRIKILRMRGYAVDDFPREVIYREFS